MYLSTKKAFYIFVILITLISMLSISLIDRYLTNELTHGIIDFELAKTPGRAQQIMDSWGKTGQIYAGFSLGIDYLFLLFYTLFFILTTHKLAQKNHRFFQNIAFFLSLVFLLAGAFDAVENYFLLQVLSHPDESGQSILTAYYFSMAKFILLGLGVMILLIGWLSKKFFRQ